MSTVVLCCNTLEDELRLVLTETGLNYPVIWVEAGLHNQVPRLRGCLAGHLTGLSGRPPADGPRPRRVLMTLGHCGGACCGLGPYDFELIMPRADDCVSLLMGSQANRLTASRRSATYFLTAGWLRHTDNLITSFDRDRDMFGSERAEHVYKIMLNHYRRFGLIETGAYDPAVQAEIVRPLADLLNLRIDRLPGDLGWLRRLLTGPWTDDDFLVLPPGRAIGQDDWRWLLDPAFDRGPVPTSRRSDL